MKALTQFHMGSYPLWVTLSMEPQSTGPSHSPSIRHRPRGSRAARLTQEAEGTSALIWLESGLKSLGNRPFCDRGHIRSNRFRLSNVVVPPNFPLIEVALTQGRASPRYGICERSGLPTE